MPPTVLIVEDEFFVRFTTAEFLRDDGFEVLEAENADEALDILKSGAPVDLLFTDVRMPGSMDGVALATLVRREWPRIPIILTSGYAPELLSARSVAEDRVISKPYRHQEVGAAIRSSSRKSRQTADRPREEPNVLGFIVSAASRVLNP